MTNYRILGVLLMAALFVASCKKEKDDEESNENEIITTVKLVFTERGSGAGSTFVWQDVDGDGGNDPVVQTISLLPASVYDVSLSLLNETRNPVEDITGEVQAESDAHRFYYEASGGTGLTVSELDKDEQGITLGLNSVWTTTDPGSGTVRLVLRHYPAGGKAESDPVNSGKSSTDMDISFDVQVAVP